MGRHIGPSNSAYLRRMSDPNRGPWLTLNAASAAKYRAALQALGVKAGKMNKTAMWKTLLQFPRAEVERAFGPKRELTDAEREEMCERMRRAGFM
jgi:hypothetical protein